MQEHLENNSSSVQWTGSFITGAMLKGKADLGHSHTLGQESGGAVEMGGISRLLLFGYLCK